MSPKGSPAPRGGRAADAAGAEAGEAAFGGLSFETALARLEEIMERLERGEITLDDSLSAFKEEWPGAALPDAARSRRGGRCATRGRVRGRSSPAVRRGAPGRRRRRIPVPMTELTPEPLGLFSAFLRETTREVDAHLRELLPKASVPTQSHPPCHALQRLCRREAHPSGHGRPGVSRLRRQGRSRAPRRAAIEMIHTFP